MSLSEACELLGVDASCPDTAHLRRRYLAAVREVHPDHNAADDAHVRTIRLSDAYRIVCAAFERHTTIADALAAEASTDPASDRSSGSGAGAASSSVWGAGPGSGSVRSGAGHRHRPGPGGFAPDPESPEVEVFEIDGRVRVIADDTVELGAPADLAFRWLEAACHRAGDITYIDRRVGILQLLVEFVGHPPCYVVFDTQGRAAFGTTEVFCTIESLDDRPPPPIARVTEYVAHELESMLE